MHSGGHSNTRTSTVIKRRNVSGMHDLYLGYGGRFEGQCRLLESCDASAKSQRTWTA